MSLTANTAQKGKRSMIQRKPLAWTLFSLFVLTDLYAVAQDSIELVPEDTCVVELTLPRGSTVKLQDRDYGTRRKITYNPLTPGKTYTVSLEIRYPSGKTTEHTLLLKSGRRVRFSQRDAAARVPELALQTGHRDDVNSVAFSPDGRILVTGSDDDTAILWDTSTGRKLRTLHEHSKPVNAVAFSPDDSGRVLTASNDGTTILWNAETGKKLRVLS